MTTKKDGWQCFVELHDDYVIKRIKTKRQVAKKATPYLLLTRTKKKDRAYIIDKVYRDSCDSIRIVKRGKVPRKHLGDPIFRKNGEIKQKRAIPLGEFTLANKKNVRKIMLRLLKFVELLWSYGVHEKTFKYHSAYGILDREIVLIDFLEITDNGWIGIEQIENKSWIKQKQLKKYLTKEEIDWFVKKGERVFNEKNFRKKWGGKIVENGTRTVHY